jgi:predicted Zn finger-like uncharacterized protein
MFTQCPECGTAFRVTAEVLKQAAGKVRCGGCSIAFNALDYLSEQKPSAPSKPAADGSVPELTPDPAELEAGKPPKTISAEQGAALLKTLDELAGSDIRIEDTGVEWRVLDEGEEPEEENETAELDDTGSMKWFIDDSPTPVDEQLSAEPGEVDAPEIFAEAAGGDELRFDDDTPLPDDFDFDAEPAPEPPPVIEARDDPSEQEAAQVDLALGDPEDWEDLLGEVDEQDTSAVAGADDSGEADSPVAAAGDIEERRLPDVDEQFATQAEAMGIDLSGIHAQAEAEAPDVDTPEARSIDDDLIAAAFEAEAEARVEREEAAEAEPDLELLVEDADTTTEDGEETEPETTTADAEDEDLDFELDFDDDDLLEARDKELVRSTDEDARLAAELGIVSEPDDGEPEKPEPLILPQSEDEQTVNMMIDQDLLAIAVEDEEGFTSTIVQKQSGDIIAKTEEPKQEDESTSDEEIAADADSPLVETIIMEGDFVRDADAEEELEEARKKAGDPSLKSATAANVGGLAREEEPPPKEPINIGLVAGIAGLVLLLLLQALHQHREGLATYPVFSNSVGSVYRMLGRPVTPAWDISGWRFEATKGSTDEDDEVLTIYSRVGNKSGDPLPYPLISVSLTDRFEDIIGSKVLEPGDYLAENLDTRKPVDPGDTFSAVISIEAPDAEATGFKLNVCYRQPGGRLKCAIDDFK